MTPAVSFEAGQPDPPGAWGWDEWLPVAERELAPRDLEAEVAEVVAAVGDRTRRVGVTAATLAAALPTALELRPVFEGSEGRARRHGPTHRAPATYSASARARSRRRAARSLRQRSETPEGLRPFAPASLELR
jgi:hypothetical protein